MYKRIETALNDPWRSIFLIYDPRAERNTYGLVLDVEGEKGFHTCAYLNVWKVDYMLQVDDEFVRIWDITFDNIPSATINIPTQFKNSFPLDMKDYWIGIDSMGMGMRLHEAMASKLDEIFYDHNRRVELLTNDPKADLTL